MRALSSFAAAALFLCLSSTAAALSQPGGAPIPSAMGCDSNKPTGLAATFACVCDAPGVCNIGAPCPDAASCSNGQNAKCETTLWHSFNDNTCIPSNRAGLDPYTDAALTPETFKPSCGLTFTLLTRGTAMFQDVFGWYNVTASRPAASELYPMLACADGPGKSVALDVKSDPRYKGGDIGFFILSPEAAQSKACADGDCCPSIARYGAGKGHLYFSERKYNDDNTGANPFIHLLVFDSKLTARKFYFAWEDIYGGSNNDFTDIVTSVDGVECSGGGEICDTGKPGRCGRGARACKNGALECMGLLGAGPEQCNGVDDDCNGKIDDSATCPNAGELCFQGHCVRSCTSGEFPCGPGLECDHVNGLCVQAGCKDVTCPDGQTCRAGKCGASCDGVLCPHGQTCVGNACLDLCRGVTCAAGQACRDGVCLAGCAQCGGIQCGAPLACDAPTGKCIDPSCKAPCPEGTFCEAGQCKDACAGAVCPEGLTCAKGNCVDPASVGPQGGLVGPDAGAGAGDGDYATRDGSACGCEIAGGSAPGGVALASVAALAIASAVRRRRRR